MEIYRIILGVLLPLFIIEGNAQSDISTTTLASSDGIITEQLASSRGEIISESPTFSLQLEASSSTFPDGSQSTHLPPTTSNVDTSVSLESSITPQLSDVSVSTSNPDIQTSTEQLVTLEYTATPNLEIIDFSSRIDPSISSLLSESISSSDFDMATSSYELTVSTTIKETSSTLPEETKSSKFVHLSVSVVTTDDDDYVTTVGTPIYFSVSAHSFNVSEVASTGSTMIVPSSSETPLPSIAADSSSQQPVSEASTVYVTSNSDTDMVTSSDESLTSTLFRDSSSVTPVVEGIASSSADIETSSESSKDVAISPSSSVTLSEPQESETVLYSITASSLPLDYAGDTQVTSSTVDLVDITSSDLADHSQQSLTESVHSQSENVLQTAQLETLSASSPISTLSSNILAEITTELQPLETSQSVSQEIYQSTTSDIGSTPTQSLVNMQTQASLDTQTHTLIYPSEFSSLAGDASISESDISSDIPLVSSDSEMVYPTEDASTSTVVQVPPDTSSVQDFVSVSTFHISYPSISQATYQTQVPANTFTTLAVESSYVESSSVLVKGDISSVVFSSVQSSNSAITSVQDGNIVVTSDESVSSTVMESLHLDNTASESSVISSDTKATVSFHQSDQSFGIIATETSFFSSSEIVLDTSPSLNVFQQSSSVSNFQSKGSSLFNEQSSAVVSSSSAYVQTGSFSESLDLYLSEIQPSPSKVTTETESLFSMESISSSLVSDVHIYPSDSQSESYVQEQGILSSVLFSDTIIVQSVSESGYASVSFESSYAEPSPSFQPHETDIIFTYTLSVTVPSEQETSSSFLSTERSADVLSMTDSVIKDSSVTETESVIPTFQPLSSASPLFPAIQVTESALVSDYLSSSIEGSEYPYPSQSESLQTSSFSSQDSAAVSTPPLIIQQMTSMLSSDSYTATLQPLSSSDPSTIQVEILPTVDQSVSSTSEGPFDSLTTAGRSISFTSEASFESLTTVRQFIGSTSDVLLESLSTTDQSVSPTTEASIEIFPTSDHSVSSTLETPFESLPTVDQSVSLTTEASVEIFPTVDHSVSSTLEAPFESLPTVDQSVSLTTEASVEIFSTVDHSVSSTLETPFESLPTTDQSVSPTTEASIEIFPTRDRSLSSTLETPFESLPTVDQTIRSVSDSLESVPLVSPTSQTAFTSSDQSIVTPSLTEYPSPGSYTVTPMLSSFGILESKSMGDSSQVYSDVGSLDTLQSYFEISSDILKSHSLTTFEQVFPSTAESMSQTDIPQTVNLYSSASDTVSVPSFVIYDSSSSSFEGSNTSYVGGIVSRSVLPQSPVATESVVFGISTSSFLYSNASREEITVRSMSTASSMSRFLPVIPSESDILLTSTESLQTASLQPVISSESTLTPSGLDSLSGSSASSDILPSYGFTLSSLDSSLNQLLPSMSLESSLYTRSDFSLESITFFSQETESPQSSIVDMSLDSSGIQSEVASELPMSVYPTYTMFTTTESLYASSGADSLFSSSSQSLVILPTQSFIGSSLVNSFFPIPTSRSLESSLYATTSLSFDSSLLITEVSGSLQSSQYLLSQESSDMESTEPSTVSYFTFPTTFSQEMSSTMSLESLYNVSGVESIITSSSETIIYPSVSFVLSSTFSTFYPQPSFASLESSLYTSTGLSLQSDTPATEISGSLQTSSFYIPSGSSDMTSTDIYPVFSSETVAVVLSSLSSELSLSSSTEGIFLSTSLGTTDIPSPVSSAMFSDISTVQSDLSTVPDAVFSSTMPVLPSDTFYTTRSGLVSLVSRSTFETVLQSKLSTLVPSDALTSEPSISTEVYSSVISESDIFTSSVSMETFTSFESTSDTSVMVDTLTPTPSDVQPLSTVLVSSETQSSSVIESQVSLTPTPTLTPTVPPSSSSEILSSSVIPTTPTTPTTPPTTPSLNTSETLKEFWVVTVIKVRRTEDVTTDAFKSNIQDKLATVYQEAFTRQELINNGTYTPLKRRKRYATSPDGRIKLQVVDVKREDGVSDTKVTYLAEKDGKLVPADTMVNTLGLLYDQEVALALGYVISTKAEPYVPVPVTPDIEDRKLWIIAAVLGPLALLLVIWIIVCLACRFCCNKKRVEEPHLMKVRRDGKQVESEFGMSDGPPDYPPEQGNQRSNGIGIIKSGTKKMSYEVNPDPDDETAVYAEVKKPVEAGHIPKKKKHPSPSHHSQTGDSVVYVSEDDHMATSAKRKGKKQKQSPNEGEDTNPPIENMVEPYYQEPRPKPLPVPRAHKQQQSGVLPTPEEEEELMEKAEMERLKNKHRLREQRKRDKHNNTGSARSRDPEVKDVYRKAQKEIDAVLGAPEQEDQLPDVFVHKHDKAKKRSTRRRRESHGGHSNEAFTEDEQEGSSQSGESLEEAKRRMHRLLDDAFSLISSSRSSIGNKVTPMSSPKKGSHLSLPEGPGKDTTPEVTPRSNGNVPDDKSKESKPVEEKKHTPMFFNPAFSGKDDTGLETWSPYRAADEVALISLPQTQTVLDKTPTQERLQTTTFTESYPTSMRDSYYTTEPAKPIVIRTKDLLPDSQDTMNSGKPSNPKHQTVNGIGSGGETGGLPNGDASYPGMKGYEDIPLHSVSGKHFIQDSQKENGDVPHRAPVKTWAGQDELDIVSSLNPGASPQPFIRSLREELEHLSTRVGDNPSGVDSKGNAQAQH